MQPLRPPVLGRATSSRRQPVASSSRVSRCRILRRPYSPDNYWNHQKGCRSSQTLNYVRFRSISPLCWRMPIPERIRPAQVEVVRWREKVFLGAEAIMIFGKGMHRQVTQRASSNGRILHSSRRLNVRGTTPALDRSWPAPAPCNRHKCAESPWVSIDSTRPTRDGLNFPKQAFDALSRKQVSLVSRIGVIEPGMIGIMRPPEVAPKRDFEGTQECVFLPDFAMAFSLFSGIGLGLRKLSPSITTR